MRELLEKRVSELEDEYRAGQEMLSKLDAQRADLQQTLLRISGALQVLTELLTAEAEPATNGAEPARPAASGQQPVAPSGAGATATRHDEPEQDADPRNE